MRLAIWALLGVGALGLCLAVPEKTVRWCTVSDHEATKCSSFQEAMGKVLPADGPLVTCVKRSSHLDCIHATAEKKADAVTVEGGLVFEASLPPYNLKPVAAEVYGSKDDPQTRHYIVAVAKKGTGFQLSQLRGRKSCHPGLGWATGWHVPLSALLPSGSLGTEAARFFGSSCVPCAGSSFPSLCRLCAGQGPDRCACSSQEPYFGYSGAFRCLQDGVGDVSFVRHMTVFEVLPEEADRAQYELLCPDNTRKPVDQYEQCHLAKVPSHAVVARSMDGKEDVIWEVLNKAQEHFGKGKRSEFQLFGSPHGRDLLFTDAAWGFLRVPPKMDAKLYLGYEYLSGTRHLETGVQGIQRVRWCAVGPQEKARCEEWSAVSGGAVACTVEETPEDCLAAIVIGDGDAMTVDGGHAYLAGQCGLVPVLAENYEPKPGSERLGSKCVNAPLEGYYVVAVVKKSDVGITWNSLRGKKSCHVAVGSSAGWHVPMGLIYNQTGSCKFDEFFSRGCAPGSNPDSPLCALCGGSDNPAHTCAPNSNERYFGSTGALRCLVEKGDVAFVKHSTVLENTNGKNPEAWAKDLKQADFELLCLDGTRKPVSEAQSCHLATVPNHAVVSRKDKADFVRRILFNQQELFGRNGFEYRMFQLFDSSSKDLLFSHDTECLANLQNKTTYDKYIGPDYLTVMANFKQCLTSGLLDACSFHRN
ncbi:inhibitor of carbonic anhydrase-like [Perognathus longimembris pacificus]|uniref:inhibitor of carbonic anhydrase-like n=1 Tax=Perognathus longimembris pacificus TaxID=214514 RepID=UPI002019BB00|nr:inhibitor of carbonic anhydrase-like [Perognathus longimembris pacificus]